MKGCSEVEWGAPLPQKAPRPAHGLVGETVGETVVSEDSLPVQIVGEAAFCLLLGSGRV